MIMSELTNNNSNRKRPILYARKEDCCGCFACVAICPCDAISVIQDQEGFNYPFVDGSQCINCGMCIKICPLKETKETE